jgi:hypothetical protein
MEWNVLIILPKARPSASASQLLSFFNSAVLGETDVCEVSSTETPQALK